MFHGNDVFVCRIAYLKTRDSHEWRFLKRLIEINFLPRQEKMTEDNSPPANPAI